MKYLGLMLFITLAFSCEKENETPPQQIIDSGGISSISGEWHLQSIMTFSPSTMEFELGDYVWTINDTQNSLDVIQTIETEVPFIALEGDQTFGLTILSDSLLTDIYDFGYDFQDSVLFVSDGPELDGPIYRFIRP